MTDNHGHEKKVLAAPIEGTRKWCGSKALLPVQRGRRNCSPGHTRRLVYDVGVRFWIVSVAGWAISILALLGIASIPGRNLDLYFNDKYVTCSKATLAAIILFAMVLPLVAAAIRHFRQA